MLIPRGLVTAGAFDTCTRAILSESFAISHFLFLRFWCFDLRGLCFDPWWFHLVSVLIWSVGGRVRGRAAWAAWWAWVLRLGLLEECP